MKGLRFKEIACVVLLVLFVVSLSSQKTQSEKTAQEIFDGICEVVDISELSECDENKIEEKCDVSFENFSSAVYYASDYIMEVREVLILKPNDASLCDDIMATLEEKTEEKKTLFEGYAPNESALISNYVLEEKSGIIIYAVCDNPQQLKDTFKSLV